MNTATVNILEMLTAFVTKIKRTSGQPGSGGDSIESLKTGFRFLDHCIGGCEPGDYIILAGRSGSGKTTFALNIALQVVLGLQRDVLFFSLSSTKEIMMRKVFTILSQIPFSKISQGRVEMKDLAKIDRRCSAAIGTGNLLVQDGMYEIADIEAEVFAAKEKGNLSLVIIDHLQLIDNTLHHALSDRPSETASVSRSIRKLSKLIGVPIILLSSVKAEVDLRELNKRPLLTDLEAPSSVEGDCDMIWMLYRDELYFRNDDNPNIGVADLAILKNRRGGLNLIEMTLIEECQRFEDITNYSDLIVS